MTETTITKPDPHWGSLINMERMNLVLQILQSKSDKILDYGCGSGSYVETLCSMGYACDGLDIFRYPAWDTSSYSGKYSQCSGDLIPVKDQFYDVTFSFEVLEHCLHPVKILKELKRVTQRTLLISVPNCEEDGVLSKYSLAKRHWIDKTHCNFWTENTFHEFLTSNGCVVDKIIPVFKIDINSFYWNYVDVNKTCAKVMKRLMSKNCTPLYSSMLAVIHIR